MELQLVEEKMLAVLRKELVEHAKKNLPFVFKDKSCKKANQFIYKYPDGKKMLIQLDVNDSSERVLKVF